MTLLDTSVLVYAVNADAPQHAPSRQVLNAARAGLLAAALVPQVLTEFYSVVTSPKRVAHPLDAMSGWAAIASFLADLPLLDVPRGCLRRMEALIAVRRPSGADVFDLFLAAQVLEHGLQGVCTYDAAAFAGLTGVRPETPEQVLARLPLPPARG